MELLRLPWTGPVTVIPSLCSEMLPSASIVSVCSWFAPTSIVPSILTLLSTISSKVPLALLVLRFSFSTRSLLVTIPPSLVMKFASCTLVSTAPLPTWTKFSWSMLEVPVALAELSAPTAYALALARRIKIFVLTLPKVSSSSTVSILWLWPASRLMSSQASIVVFWPISTSFVLSALACASASAPPPRALPTLARTSKRPRPWESAAIVISPTLVIALLLPIEAIASKFGWRTLASTLAPAIAAVLGESAFMNRLESFIARTTNNPGLSRSPIRSTLAKEPILAVVVWLISTSASSPDPPPPTEAEIASTCIILATLSPSIVSIGLSVLLFASTAISSASMSALSDSCAVTVESTSASRCAPPKARIPE